ncbi:MAG: DUF4244 domain-containing protein [Microthrixaceae bacterium]
MKVAETTRELSLWILDCQDQANRGPLGRERAQSTVEYALVLLGAAALALLLVSWVTGTDVIGRLFDAVFSRILTQAG